MPNDKYLMGFLLNNGQQPVSAIFYHELAQYIAGRFSITFTEFGFIVAEEGRERQKTLRYIVKNIDKLRALDPASILSVYFESFSGERDYQNPMLSLSALVSGQCDFPSKLKVVVDPAIVSHSFGPIVREFTHKMSELRFSAESGVAFNMDKSKMPMFFLSGIETSGLTKEEAEIAHSLTRNIRDYRRKIWDVFSYNLVKKQLLRPELVSEIADIVTPGNIIELGDKYIISLGDDGKGGAEAELRRERLRKLFQRENLIMYRKY